MTEDAEILRELWDSRLAVSFRLAAEEVFSATQPEELFLHLPRLTYLPLVADRVEKYFKKFVDLDQLGEMWMEDEATGTPIRWHYPIGVLADLAGAGGAGGAGRARQPWALTVRFRGFPESELLHCPPGGRDAVEAHFMSAVKEADGLKHRSQVINTMQSKDHKQLFAALVAHRYDQFWAVNRKLMERTGGDPFRYIPFRIHQPDRHFLQALFRPVDEGPGGGRARTLGDLIRAVVPSFVIGENGGAESEGKRRRVLLHGGEPPLSASVQWLSEHMSYPDNFLHICIVDRD